MKVKNEERIARLEAICAKMRAEEPDVQENALQSAVLVHDEELAAALARVIRNRKLEESDGKLAFDRFGITLPDNITATTMLKAFKELIEGLKSLLSGEWAVYRQALRDLPEQQGFPFNIEWPEAPEGNVNENG